MIHLDHIKNLYFIGIGGIGMSALARFFHAHGKMVSGYDKTESTLTRELTEEGMPVVYHDHIDYIRFLENHKDSTLVVVTPAVPVDHQQWAWFRDRGFSILKRSQLLGLVSEKWTSICVSGTHGKTTVSTLTAHIMKQSRYDCHAFLGGISKNYHTNYLSSNSSQFVVLEADEFDRSFLTLSPSIAVITSVDADHLDIYGDKKHVIDAFEQFTGKLKEGGLLVIKNGVDIELRYKKEGQSFFRYSLNEPCDFYARDIRLMDDTYHFSLVSPMGIVDDLVLGVPGLLNVENAVAASALALLAGVKSEDIRKGLASFTGIKRRFDYWIKSDKICLIDDYAHHPEEIRATAQSVRALYPGKSIMAVFQPHLYSRTNDFYREFAEALSLFNQVVLLDIYPARELPLKGVSSQMIAELVRVPVRICAKEDVVSEVVKAKPDVIMTMGAGDIDRELPLWCKSLKERWNI